MKALKSIFASALGVLLAVGTAGATTITLDLDQFITGDAPPEATPYPNPWVRVTATDVTGGVDLKIEALNLTDKESIDDLYLNYKGWSSALTITRTGGDAPLANIYQGANAQNSPGGYYFDILFDFPPPPVTGSPNQDRFTDNEYAVYFVSGAVAANFWDWSNPKGYLAAAHIQSIGVDDQFSGTIGAVPEPSSVVAALLLCLPLGLAAFRGLRYKTES